MIGHYKRSKYLAERQAVELAAKGAEVVIVNPSTPIGEQDIKPTPTGRIVLDFLLGNFPAYMETGMNLVDVHDVARGHLLAFEKGRRGERYILGGENLTLKQILDILGELTGLPSPKMKVPHSVAMAFAAFDQTFNGYLGIGSQGRQSKKFAWGRNLCGWTLQGGAGAGLPARRGARGAGSRCPVVCGAGVCTSLRSSVSRAYERPGSGVRLCGGLGARGWRRGAGLDPATTRIGDTERKNLLQLPPTCGTDLCRDRSGTGVCRRQGAH